MKKRFVEQIHAELEIIQKGNSPEILGLKQNISQLEMQLAELREEMNNMQRLNDDQMFQLKKQKLKVEAELSQTKSDFERLDICILYLFNCLNRTLATIEDNEKRIKESNLALSKQISAARKLINEELNYYRKSLTEIPLCIVSQDIMSFILNLVSFVMSIFTRR